MAEEDDETLIGARASMPLGDDDDAATFALDPRHAMMARRLSQEEGDETLIAAPKHVSQLPPPRPLPPPRAPQGPARVLLGPPPPARPPSVAPPRLPPPRRPPPPPAAGYYPAPPPQGAPHFSPLPPAPAPMGGNPPYPPANPPYPPPQPAAYPPPIDLNMRQGGISVSARELTGQTSTRALPLKGLASVSPGSSPPAEPTAAFPTPGLVPAQAPGEAPRAPVAANAVTLAPPLAGTPAFVIRYLLVCGVATVLGLMVLIFLEL